MDTYMAASENTGGIWGEPIPADILHILEQFDATFFPADDFFANDDDDALEEPFLVPQHVRHAGG